VDPYHSLILEMLRYLGELITGIAEPADIAAA